MRDTLKDHAASTVFEQSHGPNHGRFILKYRDVSQNHLVMDDVWTMKTVPERQGGTPHSLLTVHRQ